MPPTVALIFMLSLLTFRLLTTVIHELGHAIPALLLTKDKVIVYMGSHGNPEKSVQLKIGRLECFFKFNLFYWKGGLCVMESKDVSLFKSFIVTISGPLFSLLTAGIGILLIYFGNFSDVITLILFALIFSCTLDFIHNIVPNSNTIKLHNGTFTHNDGMQLLTLWKLRKAYKKYLTGVHHLENKEFKEAAGIFEEAILLENSQEAFYRLGIYAYLSLKNYDKAKELQEPFSEKYEHTFDGSDYHNLGIIQIHFFEYDKAIESSEKALKLLPNNPSVLNNLGYVHGLLENHTEAFLYLNKVLKIDEKYAFAWNNRGFSKLKLGQLDEGLQDIQKSIELDPENAYAYRNLGLYYFYQKDYQKALNLYKKAFEMDATTLKIQVYLDEVKAYL